MFLGDISYSLGNNQIINYVIYVEIKNEPSNNTISRL